MRANGRRGEPTQSVRRTMQSTRREIVRRWRRLALRLFPPVLALGGGGARGFAHLGLLEVFEREGIQVRAIAGTSMGAVIGGMVLASGSVAEVIASWREAFDRKVLRPVRPLRRLSEPHEHPLLQVARLIRNRIVVSMAVSRETLLDGRALERAFDLLVPDVEFGALRRPLLAVATSFETGAEVWLGQGSLRRALAGSCAIPGLLPAVALDGQLFLDGGVVAEVPVAAARSLGWPVIAVDTAMDLPPLEPGGLVLDTMMRAQMMTAQLLRDHQLRRAQQVIRPRVGHATWADWGRFDELVEAGRAAAREWLGMPPESAVEG